MTVPTPPSPTPTPTPFGDETPVSSVSTASMMLTPADPTAPAIMRTVSFDRQPTSTVVHIEDWDRCALTVRAHLQVRPSCDTHAFRQAVMLVAGALAF